MSQNKSKTLSAQEIHHGAFVSEGRLIAFPLCFPGASIPIAADESRITALDVSLEGDVYGGTSGVKTHLFAAMFRGVTGAVFDMGAVDGSNQCAAVCCGPSRFAAFVNGANGGRIVSRRLQGLPFDLIQEWGFSRSPFEEIQKLPDGETIVHAASDSSKRFAVGVSNHSLFVVDLDEKKFEPAASLLGRGRIVSSSQNRFYGLDDENALWRFDLASRQLQRRAVKLPKGKWDQAQLIWANDNRNGTLYLTDDEGQLFAYEEESGFSPSLGQTPLSPVGSLSVTCDGRIFGSCGEGMAHLFSYHPGRKEINDLGVALSTIERRRYGYLFGGAVTGKDGEIYFGENDDLGHLWLYFPRIESA
ncbi:MAG: hypothetical protein AB1656_10855 [Candidatus Omnitrophota bacterium]